jgi:hypothetical protein
MNKILGTSWPRDWWNTVSLGVLAVIVFFMLWMSACSSTLPSATNVRDAAPAGNAPAATPAPARAAVTTTEGVPTSLADAGEYGENVYDYAKANDWKNAAVKLAALKAAAKQVGTDVKNDGVAVDRLDGHVAALERAVSSKDRQATMREANQVTLNVADMTTAYRLSVPVEVTKLDYYGRELEVWAQAQDADKLQATGREMRRTWDALRPSIEARSAPTAKKFDALVARVEVAKTPADYARVATPVLDEVDNLEKLFT